MKLSTKQLIDHYCGNAALFLLSPFVQLAGMLLGRNHRLQPVKTVLIVKFQGIGSLVIAKPAIAELRVHHPTARIIFWGSPSTCAMAREMIEFDKVISLNDNNIINGIFSCIGNLFQLYGEKLDWAIDLEVYSKLSVVLCTLTCARNRAGFAIDSVRLRRNNHTHLIFFNRQKYLGEAYRRLLTLLHNNPAGEVAYQPNAWAFDHNCFSVAGMPSADYIVLNPNAGELSLERRWPMERFDQLIDALLEYYPEIHIILIGAGASEANYCRRLKSRPRLIDAVDKLSLAQMIQCINNARLVISNDTAPLHIALLSQQPVVGLFGPTSPQAYVEAERSRARIHFQGIYCSPCVHCWSTSPCGGRNYCMQMISLENVLASCRLLLDDKSDSSSNINAPLEQLDDYYPGLVYAKCNRNPD